MERGSAERRCRIYLHDLTNDHSGDGHARNEKVIAGHMADRRYDIDEINGKSAERCKQEFRQPNKAGDNDGRIGRAGLNAGSRFCEPGHRAGMRGRSFGECLSVGLAGGALMRIRGHVLLRRRPPCILSRRPSGADRQQPAPTPVWLRQAANESFSCARTGGAGRFSAA